MSVNQVAFQGNYKVTLPNVKDIKDEKEKAAMTDVIINTVVFSTNNCIAEPKMDDKNNMYIKIADKNDAMFEQGFKNILDNCNKNFNIDAAKKAYIEKVSDEEYDKI